MDERERDIREREGSDFQHLLDVIDGLREEVEEYQEEIAEASKHVDIEIVKAEGLGKAVDICNQERKRYWDKLTASNGLREELEKAWSEAGDNMRNGVEIIKQRDATIDGLREELSISQGFQAAKQDEIDRLREENAMLGECIKARDEVGLSLQSRLTAIEKAVDGVKRITYECCEDIPIESWQGVEDLIAAVKGEK